MDKTINRLASLQITGWLLIGLIAWFFLGAQAAGIPSFSQGLSGMNEILAGSWLITRGQDHLPVLAWLFVLIGLAGILGINLAACIYRRLPRPGNGRNPFRLWIFLAIHLLFGLVMLLHGLEMFLGHKYPVHQLAAGQTAILDSNWRLEVHTVNFVNDPELLQLEKQEARQRISRDRFDMQANFVRVSLLRDQERVRTEDIRMLAPMSHKGMHVVLRGLEYDGENITARLRVVESFLHTPFTIAYGMLIITMIIWFLLTARPLSRTSGLPENAPADSH